MVSDGGSLVGEGQRVGAEALLGLGLPLRAHACSTARTNVPLSEAPDAGLLHISRAGGSRYW